jgi:hypothetical protein
MFPSDVESNKSERPWLCSSNVLTISFAASIIGVFARLCDVDSKQAEPLHNCDVINKQKQVRLVQMQSYKQYFFLLYLGELN